LVAVLVADSANDRLEGMTPRLIYLDTNLWNVLCDQGVDPARIVKKLAVRNTSLTLGNEAVYEMAKTFRDSGAAGIVRGKKLFSYIAAYLSEQIPLIRVNTELVAAEMWALQRGSSIPEILLNPGDYEITRMEIERLSHGEVSQRVKEHIETRVVSADAIRSGQVAHLKAWPDVKHQLTQVSIQQFPSWLDTEAQSLRAREHLAGQIDEYFPEATAEEASEWAEALLRSPVGRVGKAIVRRTLYYNWRCAHRESVSKDVYFDTNHVLNANYADVYATKESKQMEYAGLLLTSSTRIAVYDGADGIEQWLITQAVYDD
jgi:hypothetical protein